MTDKPRQQLLTGLNIFFVKNRFNIIKMSYNKVLYQNKRIFGAKIMAANSQTDFPDVSDGFLAKIIEFLT